MMLANVSGTAHISNFMLIYQLQLPGAVPELHCFQIDIALEENEDVGCDMHLIT